MNQRKLFDSEIVDYLKLKLKGYAYNEGWYKLVNNVYTRIETIDMLSELMAVIKNQYDSFNYSQLNNVMKLYSITVYKVFNHKDYIPFKNTILNIQTKSLIDYEACPIKFNYQLDCDLFLQDITYIEENNKVLKFIRSRVNSTKDYDLILAYINCILYQKYQINKFLQLIGQPRTGKSTFLDLITKIVDKSFVVETKLPLLAYNRFETSELENKKVLIISELPQKPLSLEILKNLTGGDLIRCEAKHRDESPHLFLKG